MKVTIDRFERDVAVVELKDKTFSHLPKLLIPQAAKEGDVISIQIDREETNQRKQMASDLLNELTNN